MDAMNDGSYHSKPVPVASYQRRVPSPPYIPVVTSAPRDKYILSPSYVKVADQGIATPDQYDIITRNQEQVALDHSSKWNYEHRRSAQRIIDWLWVGPTSVVKDADFLRQEQFTMIVAARSARLATMRMGHLDKAAVDFGLDVAQITVEDSYDMLKSMPDHINLINHHMLRVHSAQNDGTGEYSHALNGSGPDRKGKILLTCDTGNDMAGTIAAAYLMAMFGISMGKAIQYVSVQRFCCVFSEECKRLLRTWGELLRARRGVAREGTLDVAGQQEDEDSASAPISTKRTKRRVGELMDIDDDSRGATPDQDEDRFAGRDTFAPFIDVPGRQQ